MNWTQYLLSKLAEEATEVAKEALKCQQQGVGSFYNGKPAIMELRKEFLELIGVIELLEERKEVRRHLGAHHMIPVTGSGICQDDDYHEITYGKSLRLCYYAMFAYQSGELELTKEEFNMVSHNANAWSIRAGVESTNHIHFRSAQTGEKPVGPLAPVTASISSGSDVRGPLDEPKA